ncbi:MAG: hypothetical protein MI717_03095 [Spirochaetales bacterium]|nr:hypothetical protein [Spirochaetales bacterium]
MQQAKIGIGDIGIYVPPSRMRLDRLMESRSITHPELEAKLNRAIQKTGQTAFRFPSPWEDTASLAANAAVDVLDRLQRQESALLRYLAIGTETAVDHSKAASSYVQGMLQKAGYPLPTNLTTFETKHACAGGTAALLSTAAMLSYAGRKGERALAISSDIARYEAPSTAEITQGAGAVALLIEKNPRLLELDLSLQGFYSSDVDDFFRPLESSTARVKGRYSVECYQDALEKAMEDYAQRAGLGLRECMESADYLAYHVPFVTMPEMAARKMLRGACGMTGEEVDALFARTAFLDSMYLSRQFGNLYTGSLYAYLAALLKREYERIGTDIIGKKVLIASYGSGNTMIVFSATIAPQAGEVISAWNLQRFEQEAKEASFDEYLQWLGRPKHTGTWKNLLEGAHPTPGQFYLKDFDENDLRIYDRG